jgi:hypothetical protein
MKTAQRPFWRLPATMKKTHASCEKKYELKGICKVHVSLDWIIDSKAGQ